jgi:hypothetical protein
VSDPLDVASWLERAEASFKADQAAQITAETIPTLDDERLDSWLWARVCRLVQDDERSRLVELSPGLRMFFLTRFFEWEVGNGGVAQYVSNAVNSAGTQFDLIAEGYELIGLSDRAELVRMVAARVRPFEHMYRDDYRGDEPPDDDEVDRHDDVLCDLADAARLAYVRSHAVEFAI